MQGVLLFQTLCLFYTLGRLSSDLFHDNPGTWFGTSKVAEPSGGAGICRGEQGASLMLMLTAGVETLECLYSARSPCTDARLLVTHFPRPMCTCVTFASFPQPFTMKRFQKVPAKVTKFLPPAAGKTTGNVTFAPEATTAEMASPEPAAAVLAEPEPAQA